MDKLCMKKTNMKYLSLHHAYTSAPFCEQFKQYYRLAIYLHVCEQPNSAGYTLVAIALQQ